MRKISYILIGVVFAALAAGVFIITSGTDLFNTNHKVGLSDKSDKISNTDNEEGAVTGNRSNENLPPKTEGVGYESDIAQQHDDSNIPAPDFIKLLWYTEPAFPNASQDDYHAYASNVYADIFFADGKMARIKIAEGKDYGCGHILNKNDLDCEFAETQSIYRVYVKGGTLNIERNVADGLGDKGTQTVFSKKLSDIYKNPTKITNIKVYMQKGNPQSAKCSDFTIRTIPYTKQVAHASLKALLQGPTPSEYAQGYRSCIARGKNKGGVYPLLSAKDYEQSSVLLKNGVLTINIPTLTKDKIKEALPGDMERMISAFENTMKQFPTVKSARYIFGGVEYTL